MGELKKEKQISWINAIKLISCTLVFASHYFESFYFLDASEAMSPTLWTVFNKCEGLINGTLWVMVFCFISGIFAANKDIGALKSLVGESFNRYIRLAIPVFITGLFIFIMSQCGLLLNPTMGDIFHCSSYLDVYYQTKISFLDYLHDSLTFGSILNPPLWMMSMLLEGNIIIYACNYISRKANRVWVKTVLYVVLALLCCVTNRFYQAICLAGAIGSGYFQKEHSPNIGNRILAVSIALILLAVAYVDGLSGILYKLSGTLSLSFNEIKCFIAACGIMIFIKECTPVQKLLSADFLNQISKYNYTIYLVHFPIICSLSIYLFKVLLPRMNYDSTFLLVFLITSVVVGAVSVLYSKLFDKGTNQVLHYIREKIKLIEKKLPDF